MHGTCDSSVGAGSTAVALAAVSPRHSAHWVEAGRYQSNGAAMKDKAHPLPEACPVLVMNLNCFGMAETVPATLKHPMQLQ